VQPTANPILKRWQRLSGLPLGPLLFSLGLGRAVPYTATVRPRVRELRPGFARVEMADRRRVRNHLRSIHAIALVNLAEVTSGLAMLCGLPDDARGIVTGLSIEYHKKARGALTATCTCEPPATSEEREIEVESAVHDASGALVSLARVRWRIGPR
jgi:acyl-coenzyme A thioesterase PaaI-like protein